MSNTEPKIKGVARTTLAGATREQLDRHLVALTQKMPERFAQSPALILHAVEVGPGGVMNINNQELVINANDGETVIHAYELPSPAGWTVEVAESVPN